MSWIDEVKDEDQATLFDLWKKAIYKSLKYQETDNFQETAWYYIDQIRNDEYIPPQDWNKQFKRKLKEEADD